MIEGSAIGQMTTRLLTRIDGDRRRSRAVSVVLALLLQFLSMPLWQRIRLTALMLGTAVLVHVLLTGFSAPEPTALVRLGWLVIGGVLAAVMMGAHQVAAAWVDRSGRAVSRDESGRA